MLAAFGANIVLTPGTAGHERRDTPRRRDGGRRPEADILCRSSSKIRPIPAIHEKTTGPEIWNDTDGAVDVLVAGVGTGGTITGISRYHQKHEGQKDTSQWLWSLRKARSLPRSLPASPSSPRRIRYRASAQALFPTRLTLSLVDRVEQVESAEAIAVSRRLALDEGMLSGISCGAAVAAALRLARLDEFAGKTFVVILPDSGERYLSTVLFEGIGA